MIETSDLRSASGRSRAEPSTAPDHQRFRRSDEDIKRDVEHELEWDPYLVADAIAVAVKDGVVTLTGFVQSYDHKFEAEAVAKRVTGVAGVANDLESRLPDADERPDPDIAHDAIGAIQTRLPEVCQNIRVVVGGGEVTLEGQVDWQYQREMAAEAVRRIRGVKGVINLIELKPLAAHAENSRQIEAALRRNAMIDAERITVEVRGSTVILEGTVRSWAESREAERIAWAAPGISAVDNRLVVGTKASATRYRASVLMGSEVLNHRKEPIGTIDDIILSRDRVVSAVLQIGGFLGLGGRLVAIPLQDFVLEAFDRDVVRISLPGATREALEKLPEFNDGH